MFGATERTQHMKYFQIIIADGESGTFLILYYFGEDLIEGLS